MQPIYTLLLSCNLSCKLLNIEQFNDIVLSKILLLCAVFFFPCDGNKVTNKSNDFFFLISGIKSPVTELDSQSSFFFFFFNKGVGEPVLLTCLQCKAVARNQSHKCSTLLLFVVQVTACSNMHIFFCPSHKKKKKNSLIYNEINK